MDLQIAAPVFAEFVAQVYVYYEIIAGIPVAVPAETGGEQDVVGPAAVLVTQGCFHLMAGHQICIGGVSVSPVRIGVGIGVRECGVIFGTECTGEGKLDPLLMKAFVVVWTPLLCTRIVIPQNRIFCVA